jgi:23S rRNA pseudouridine1911/1915/1917 synthase
MEKKNYSVTKDDQGCRLDIFLSVKNPSFSRSRIKHLIEEGNVLVNGSLSKASHHMKCGEKISLIIPEPLSLDLQPEPIPLDIMYEDDSILVLNKPSGLVVHPGAGNYTGTLVNALLYHCKDLSGIGGTLRPGIVHRLDKDTSGVMIVAKNDQAHNSLAKQFAGHTVKKIYHAFVWGNVKSDEGTIDLHIGRHPYHRKKMSPLAKKGKKAVTHYSVMKRFRSITYLELSLETGRTHQIRVHLAAINHPVLNDPVYGRGRSQSSLPKQVAKSFKALKRQALHAHLLGILHPVNGTYKEFISPLPDDMARFIRELEVEM